MPDESFYDQFVRPNEERMMACVWRITQEREAAKDALQNALAIIWRKRDLVARHPNPEALLLRICRESTLDLMRQTARRSLHEVAVAELPEPEARHRETPRSRLCRQEIDAEVRQAIATLPGKQSLAIFMHLVEERSYSEVAIALACREATVRTHVKRGRERLRQALRHLQESCP